MDDSRIVMYIVIIAVSLVANFVRNRSKTKAETPIPMPEIPTPFPDAESKYPKKSREVTVREKAESEEIRSEKSKKTIAVSNQSKVIPVEKQNASNAQEVEWIDEFDARKAVIYSEILNPPYISNASGLCNK